MPTRVIRTIGEWEAERAAWEEIYTSGHHTPFQRYEWLSGWWAYAGAGKLHIIEVDDDAGRALGFAPFFLRKRYYGWPLPHLAFIGTKRADYLDFLVRDGAEAVFFRELFHALQRADRPLVLVDLRDVPESSANIPWVEREAGRQAWFCVTDRCTVCVACRLPADWRTFLRSLSVRNQRHVRYDRRNLARRCTAAFRDCRAPQDV